MSTKPILTQSTEHKQDPLRAAFRRLHRHSITYRMVAPGDLPTEKPPKYNYLPLASDLPEPMSFVEQFKAAFLRGLRRAK